MVNPVVLYVNHRQQACGVQQFGQKLLPPMRASTRYDVFYIDIDRREEFDHWTSVLNPQIVVYNFYSSATMPWLTAGVVRQNRNRFKQASIFHELPLESMGFDLLIHQDPTNEDTERYANITRPIPEYRPPAYQEGDMPIFSSFGFGLGGKGFSRFVQYICDHYDEARIRINIPYAAFGDSAGVGARNWAADCQRNVSKPGIQLEITHDLLPENDLIDWLGQSTANCFFYDINHGRGLTGTLDYALAAMRPFAITQSWQFKHIWTIDDYCCIEQNSLSDIIQNGYISGDYFRNLWTPQELTASFERAFDRLLGV